MRLLSKYSWFDARWLTILQYLMQNWVFLAKMMRKNKVRWKRVIFGNKKATLPVKNSCLCNMDKLSRARWERCTSLIAELCERPRSEIRCDISLFRNQVGRKTCVTRQINTSQREKERGHSPNQSLRCWKHLGQHLATEPFSLQKAPD